MPHQNPSDDQLRKLLTEGRTIAMVGASSSPDKPSHGIMQKMLAAGYRVIPVNPRETEVLGQKAFASLREIPEKVDIVDVFRRAEDTPAIADEAVAIGAKAIWLQSGISNEETARRAEAGGLLAVMDACIGVEHSLLRIPPKT
jgi:predicted CoA-binding protein